MHKNLLFAATLISLSLISNVALCNPCTDTLRKIFTPFARSEIEDDYVYGWHGIHPDNLKIKEDTVKSIVESSTLIASDGVFGTGVYFYSEKPNTPNDFPFAAWINFRIRKSLT